jgi:hypothetical protein
MGILSRVNWKSSEVSFYTLTGFWWVFARKTWSSTSFDVRYRFNKVKMERANRNRYSESVRERDERETRLSCEARKKMNESLLSIVHRAIPPFLRTPSLAIRRIYEPERRTERRTNTSDVWGWEITEMTMSTPWQSPFSRTTILI